MEHDEHDKWATENTISNGYLSHSKAIELVSPAGGLGDDLSQGLSLPTSLNIYS